MGLALADRWVWDFWLVQDGDEHHLFFLQAPRSLGDPHLRHWNSSVGHAVSSDLVTWDLLPDALGAGPPGSWDDGSTWTGSVLRDGAHWVMAYTATSTAEGRLVQRVGIARSVDMVTWEKHDAPVLEADPRWYETLDPAVWFDQAWRDPWLFRLPGDHRVHALLTARTRTGEPWDRGAVAHAVSRDFMTWEVGPPVTSHLGAGQLEVPQLVELEDRWYLLYCSDEPTQGPRRRADGPGTGTFYLVADEPLGPFRAIDGGVLAADRHGSTYAGRLHRDGCGDPVFLAWRRHRPDGAFVGELADPRRVLVAPDGRLSLEPA